jgi:hypothetical protein
LAHICRDFPRISAHPWQAENRRTMQPVDQARARRPPGLIRHVRCARFRVGI